MYIIILIYSTSTGFHTHILRVSCQDKDYSSLGWRADFYWFTRLQVQEDQQMHELLSHEWMAHGYSCNYLFVVESEKELFRVTAVRRKLFLFPVKILEASITLLQCIELSPVSLTLIPTAVLILGFFYYWKLQQAESSTWEICLQLTYMR